MTVHLERGANMIRTGQWAGWLAAIVGHWVLVTAFIWENGGSGNPRPLF